MGGFDFAFLSGAEHSEHGSSRGRPAVLRVHGDDGAQLERRQLEGARAAQRAYLFEDHPVYVGVERRHEEGRRDDGAEVEENEVVVVHDVEKKTSAVEVVVVVPAHEGEEAYEAAGHPAHGDDD